MVEPCLELAEHTSINQTMIYMHAIAGSTVAAMARETKTTS
jgi:hypothetical protein